jgi:hypothetical protein
MTSEPVRDRFPDHLLTPQNCALIIIDYQPVQVSSIRSMDQEGPAGRLPEQRHRRGGLQPARHRPTPVPSGRRRDRGWRRPDPSPGPAALGLERGIPVITKSTHRDRIEENLRIFDFDLPDEAMPRLDAPDRTGGTSNAIETRIKWW